MSKVMDAMDALTDLTIRVSMAQDEKKHAAMDAEQQRAANGQFGSGGGGGAAKAAPSAEKEPRQTMFDLKRDDTPEYPAHLVERDNRARAANEAAAVKQKALEAKREAKLAAKGITPKIFNTFQSPK